MSDFAIATLVRRFYGEIWNAGDDALVDELIAEDFVFRGTLGDEERGREGFRRYRDKVWAAFADFHNEVVDLVAESERAAARIRCTGTHAGPLFGVAPTGRTIAYDGAAFFTAGGGRLTGAWVLGDVVGLRRQLGAE